MRPVEPSGRSGCPPGEQPAFSCARQPCRECPQAASSWSAGGRPSWSGQPRTGRHRRSLVQLSKAGGAGPANRVGHAGRMNIINPRPCTGRGDGQARRPDRSCANTGSRRDVVPIDPRRTQRRRGRPPATPSASFLELHDAQVRRSPAFADIQLDARSVRLQRPRRSPA